MTNNKVIWSEGMFLRPQHFQQHDRFIHDQNKKLIQFFNCFGWGLKSLSIDEQQLGLGKLIINHCEGVMPDGTLFSINNSEQLPLIFEGDEELKDEIIYLNLPLSTEGNPDAKKNVQTDSDSAIRYLIEEQDIRDSNVGQHSVAQVDIGKLCFTLKSARELKGQSISLALCRIVEKRSDKTIVLDDDFIPGVLDCSASINLKNYHKEIISLLNHRSEAIAVRFGASGKGGTSDFSEFLLLQLVNKYEALMQHLLTLDVLHPETLFKHLITLYGELSTFTVTERRPDIQISYDHNALSECFSSIMSVLRQSLSLVLDQNAIQLPMQERNYGISVATVNDKNLLNSAHFVLAVKASIATDVVRSTFPGQVKIGPVEHIRDLVNLQLPGIKLHALPIAPRQIPYHSGFTYFQLDKQSDTWTQLAGSGGFAFHVSDNFPDLEMEFWAIKQ